MDRFQFFHLCNHKFSIASTDPSIHEITVQNSGDFVDVLIERARILDIIEVIPTTYPSVGPSTEFDYDYDGQDYEDPDAQDGYFDDDIALNIDYRSYFDVSSGSPVGLPLPKSFYNLYLNNRIKWNVKAPTDYLVRAKILFSASDFKIYERVDCPRCQGNGWYVDLFNTHDIFQSASGLEYVAQRVVKDLFTEVKTNLFDTTYGTTLQRQMFQMHIADEALFNHIRASVMDVQRQYLFRQAPILNDLLPSERLVALSISQIQRMNNSSRILLDLIIRTEVETQNLRIPLFGGGL